MPALLLVTCVCSGVTSTDDGIPDCRWSGLSEQGRSGLQGWDRGSSKLQSLQLQQVAGAGMQEVMGVRLCGKMS